MNAERFYNDHQRFMTVGHYRLAVVADLSCDCSDELINFSSENEYFNGSYRWLLFSEFNMSKTMNTVRKQNLNIDSRVTVVVETIEENLEFFEIFGTVRRRGGRTHVTKVGSKTKSSGIVWTCTTNSYYVRDDLGGVTLQGAVAILQRTNVDVVHELYERKVLSHEFGFTNISMGISLVKKGGYAFHCDNSYGNTFIMRTFSDHEICELQEMSLFPPRAVHLNVPKGSPLKEIFRVTLRRLLEIGLAEYYQRKLFMKRPPCLKQNTASVQVRLEDIEDLCILLAIGASVSIAILLIEIVEFRVRRYWDIKQFAKHYTGWLD
ncbi:uncharacterized protein LOC120415367 [Culex pipiens pallens]|uniref:uncharacterized protein LOC120415367 n=1 Tax=Culex pipiens pallens TaxID=42434 RepID=UPI0022AB07A9|nr:uncharacterized protein LOC120415367 [Culex pipiens pallens]